MGLKKGYKCKTGCLKENCYHLYQERPRFINNTHNLYKKNGIFYNFLLGTFNLHYLTKIPIKNEEKNDHELLENELSRTFKYVKAFYTQAPCFREIARLSRGDIRDLGHFVRGSPKYNFVLLWVINSVLIENCYVREGKKLDEESLKQLKKQIKSGGES